MEIRGENEKPETDRLVVTLGDPPRVRTDGVSAILELLETRYNIAEAVIFHRTKMNAMSLLERALTFCIFKDGNIKQLKATLERELLKKSEDGFVSLLVDNPELLFGDIKQEYSKKVKSLALRFQRRDYYDTLYLISRQEKRLDIKAEPVQEYYAFGNDAPINRMKALDILEDDFDFPRGSITMYCPDPKMNSKLARVRIYFDSRMGTLDKLEDDLEEHMTGGHLKAQLKRFRKLWRVSFFINPTVLPREKKERKDLREVIQKTIETLVLGLGDSGEKRTEALKIAKSLCSLPEWSEKYEPSEYIEGAPHYPSGFPCVKSFLVKKQKDSRRVEAETERWVTEDEILTVLNRFQSPLVNVDIRRSVENEVAKFVQNFRVGFHLPVHARFRGLLSSINITVHPERNRIGVTPDEVRSGLDFLLIEAKGADDKA
jgi:hypothetical protein